MSSQVFLTSDEHYSHAKILQLMNRPFPSIEEMNESLIANHNSIVRKGDRVYHLGDFAWFNGEAILSRLNGQHYLIKGNHDWRGQTPKGFIWVKDVEQLTIGTDTVYLSHYAHRVWPRSHYGSYHFHGHSHGMLPSYGRSMDVGVDACDYAPVEFSILRDLLVSREYMLHHPEEG